jgi:hypothetical protein
LDYLKKALEDKDKTENVRTKEIISILKIFDEFLSQSEIKGTTGLKQQRSLLKGELLSKIQITNSVSYNQLIGRYIELSMFSNSTVYDIKRIIGQINKVPAEYVRLIRYSTTNEIKDVDNGKTLAELNFKNNESLIASKQNMGNIPKAPLLNKDKSLTPEAIAIFGEWFDDFSHDGFMTPEDCVEFIRSCTDDKCKTTDGRVRNLFNNHDKNGEGRVNKDGFIEFYRLACVRKEEVVRANILAHNYRNDLRKISDMIDENTDKTVLPRYILAHEQKYFDTLFSLLSRDDESSKFAWDLIQKLVTNPTYYDKIVKLNVEKDNNGKANWDSLIDTKSIFKLLYMFQIVESLIEEGGENDKEFVKVYRTKNMATSKPKDTKSAAPSTKKKDEDKKDAKEAKEEEEAKKPKEYLVSDLLQEESNEENNAELIKSWILRFLKIGGFEFSYSLFTQNQKAINEMTEFQKNFLGFILKILRIFITAAFLATKPELGESIDYVRQQTTEAKPPQDDEEEDWRDDDHDDEDKYSTPKKTVGPRVEIINLHKGGHEVITEDELFEQNEMSYDYDSDKERKLFKYKLDIASVEEVKLDKKESTFSKQKKKGGNLEQKITQLSNQLQGDFGKDLLDSIDFIQLQTVILHSIASLITKEEMDQNETKIVENSLSLWLGCILHNDSILKDFFEFNCDEFSNVKDLLIRGILYPSAFNIREKFLYTLYIFATKKTVSDIDTFEYTFNALLMNLPKDTKGEESFTAQYFELVYKLIEEYFKRISSGEVRKDIFDTPKFFEDVVERIKSHQSREVRNSKKQDETLVGYLKLAHMVLESAGVGQ